MEEVTISLSAEFSALVSGWEKDTPSQLEARMEKIGAYQQHHDLSPQQLRLVAQITASRLDRFGWRDEDIQISRSDKKK